MVDQLNFISQSWWNWMAPMFWQVSLLVFIIGGIDLLIRKWAWPQIRYALWFLILLKLVIPPTWSNSMSIVPNLRAFIPNIKSSEIISTSSNQISLSQIPESKSETEMFETETNFENKEIISPKNNSIINKSASIDWKLYLMATWLFGILIFSGMLLFKISKLKKWHQEQEKKKNIPLWFHELLVKTGKRLLIERLPAIVFSNEAVSPAVYGVFRPVLLLPEKYIDSLSEEEAEHILLHELAHIKRGDLIIHGICLLLQIIYWFNPFLIWTRKQMKHVREICCDLTIANILREKTSKYRQTLVNSARELLTESLEPGLGLLGLFEEPFRLIARLKWLEKKTWEKRKLAFGITILTSFLFSAFVLPMGALDFQNIATIEIEDEIESVKEKVMSHTVDLNLAYLDWNLETIENFYTKDVILSQEGEPTLSGIEAVMNDLRRQKFSGIKFHDLQNFIFDIWKDRDKIYVCETFRYSLSLEVPKLTLSGSGKSFTIWQVLEDDSLKIKYSIYNIDSATPNIINEEE